MMRVLFSVLLILCLPVTTMAHKVIAGVYATGSTLEGEIGYSDGSVATSQAVQVLNAGGEVIAELTTDADGFFTYEPATTGPLTFFANLGSGHVANIFVSADEMPQSMRATEPVSADAVPADVPEAVLPVTESLIRAVRAEIRPLRSELTALKERQTFQSIVGGIGYIIGLFGLAAFIMARRERRAADV